MKTQKVLKITALSCIAVFALGVLIFGLVTGFGIEDVKAAVKQWKDQGRLPAIRDSIKRTKALDYLAENAKVTVKDEVAERAEAQKAESAE